MKLFNSKPEYCGYYYIFPQNNQDQLDNTPEIAYLYYDGKYQLFRAGVYPNRTKFDDIQYWYGPIEDPKWPKEILEWLKKKEGECT